MTSKRLSWIEGDAQGGGTTLTCAQCPGKMATARVLIPVPDENTFVMRVCCTSCANAVRKAEKRAVIHPIRRQM